MIENFTNKYGITKTLRFRLIPQGKTEENFEIKVLEEDVKKAEAYPRVKEYIDNYHRNFIEKVLINVKLTNLNDYAKLYFLKNKDEKQKKEQLEVEKKMRKEIANSLTKDKDYDLLKDSKLVEVVLKNLANDDDEIKDLQTFNKFTTYFTGFNENRANMYSNEEKSTAISYRIVNENLPKFLDNIRSFEKIVDTFSNSEWEKLNADFSPVFGLDIRDVFTVDYFNFTLSQSGIDIYNNILGGYTKKDGAKIQGLNERINLFCQKNKDIKLPQMKMLYKQILSKSDNLSFVLDKYENDAQIITSLGDFFTIKLDGIRNYMQYLNDMLVLFQNLNEYDCNKIYVKNDLSLTTISQKVYGSWSCVQDAINNEYDQKNIKKSKKDFEKYSDDRRKALKKIESYSLNQIQQYAKNSLAENYDGENIQISLYIQLKELNDNVGENFKLAQNLILNEYPSDKNLISDDESIGLIKNLLDSIKQFQSHALLLMGSKKESEKDLEFYGKYDELISQINVINQLYDKVRNYLTQKPYSKDKIKLNFGSPTLLKGWDKNKEDSNLTIILRKDEKYFLAVMDKKSNKIFDNLPDINDTVDVYEKMHYKLLPGPNKMLPKVFFSQKGIENFNPSSEILELYKDGCFKKGETFDINKCHKLIDFFKKSINIHEDWRHFDFNFSETKNYSDISSFYREVEHQGYKVNFEKVGVDYINNLVEEGKLYLFQIYNKDFSENKKAEGTPNLHTMYFKALFSEQNLNNPIYKLNGESEMFYRFASIKPKKPTHPANEPIGNKNLLKIKNTSTFPYDLIKDKRFTKNQFSLHLPITLNFKSYGNPDINTSVMREIKNKDEQYIIGIDRGERHLIYISVINGKGEIVEQHSLNQIVNECKGVEHRVDYHQLLNKKEKDRLDARKNWKSVENIKELKEGYISQVVHKICLLMQKYDAIIAMEDLNSAFKNSRIKVEKQTYQKFEKMLIDKLNYYVDKTKSNNELGGIYNAYQLTNKFESFKKMKKQNGIIFYIPAWLTSKIDPTTGFVDLLKPKYTSIPSAKEFIKSFDCIKFNEKENYFEFHLDYNKFPRANADYLKNWVVCTNGERLYNFRNKDKNSEWDTKVVNLTQEFKSLFEANSINYNSDNLIDLLIMPTSSSFYNNFIHLLKLTLQMRNSQTGTEIDYLISPVKNKNGEFYDSRNFDETSKIPDNADANGAFNIALKAKWVVEQIKGKDENNLRSVTMAMKNQEWLEFAQNRNV